MTPVDVLPELPEPMDESVVMKLWRRAGLPEYFLGNEGTNVHLCEFARLIALQAIAAEREQAERYRWLKTHARKAWERFELPFVPFAPSGSFQEQTLDAAIDIARSHGVLR